MDYDDEGSQENKGARKRNIFDDDVSEDAARSIIKSVQIFDDEVSEEGFMKVNIKSNHFGGQDVTFDKSSNQAPVPDLSSLATPATRTRPSKPISTSTSFGGVSRAMGFGHTRTQSLTTGMSKAAEALKVPDTSGFSSTTSLEADEVQTRSVKSLPKFGASSPSTFSSSSSLHDFDEGGSARKQMSAADIDKMQQEIQSLRRSLLSAKKDRWVKQPVEDTLRRIVKGEDYSLELYKSLSDKLALLDGAIRSHDGNAVTAAVLFLQRTVSRHIFSRELVQRPSAANHYLIYLKAHYDFPEYINTLIMLGRTEEAAIFKYQLALPTPDATVKISKLKECLRSHFQADPTLSYDTSLVEEHLDLLERQRPIEDSDSSMEASGRSALFKDFPRKRSLINMSVVTTLYYCCLYHYDLGENSLASPAALKKRHQISDKQYTWTAIGARAKLHQWKDIENILTTKGWFGSSKLKAPIGFDKVVGILHKNAAPQDILQKYLSMIDNLEVRLNLAKKISCHLGVIDALVALKNRPDLEQYASTLDRYSKEGLYAFDILNTSTIKWK